MSLTLPRVAAWRLGKTRQGPATGRSPTRRGLLHPAETEQAADLRRDAPVAAALQPFVERYWSVRWDRTGQPPFRSEVLSHPSVNVSVEIGHLTRGSASRCPPSTCTAS